MRDKSKVVQIKKKFKLLKVEMNEKLRRQWAAAEAQAYGWGGIQAVVSATKMAANTIRRGLEELEDGAWGIRSSRRHSP